MFRKRKSNNDDGAFEFEQSVVERVLAQYPAGTRVSFGAPTRCPFCANFGLVEGVDLSVRHAHNRCLSCGATWVITARALAAVQSRPTAAPVPVSASPQSQPIRLAKPAPRVPALAGAPATPFRILHVEDNPMDVAIVKELLRPAGGDDVIDLRSAPSRESGLAAAASHRPDLVLLDLGLPDSHGLATVAQWNFQAVPAPVLVVSGACGPDVMAQARRLGVVDFLDKADLNAYVEQGEDGSRSFVHLLERCSA